MFATEPATPVEAPGLFEALNRYRVLVIGLTLAGLILGVIVTLVTPDSTEAVGRITLSDPRGATLFRNGSSVQVDLPRYLSDRVSYASSTEVLERALEIRQAGGVTDDLRQSCTIEPDETSNVIAIRCAFDTTEDSIKAVDAIASAYRQGSKAQTEDKAKSALAALQDDLQSVKDSIEKQRAEAAKTDTFSTALATSLGDRLTAVESRMSDIKTESALFEDGVSSYDAARIPIPPSFLFLLVRNLVVGTAIGALIAVVIAWFRADRSPLVASGGEFAELLGLPLLGEVPISLIQGQGVDIVATPEPAFQLLASNLSSIRSDGLLVFLTPSPMYGHEDIVIKSALVAARAGKRVLLIDLDESNNAVSRTLGMADGPGFGEFAIGRVTHDSVIARIGFAASPGLAESVLYLMGPGSSSGDLAALLRSRQAEEALRMLRGLFDVIFIDGPPLLTSAGAASLGNVADGVVMIVQRNTPKVTLDNVRRQLSFVNSDPVGFVLVDAE